LSLPRVTPSAAVIAAAGLAAGWYGWLLLARDRGLATVGYNFYSAAGTPPSRHVPEPQA
jgi:hypothetical protein